MNTEPETPQELGERDLDAAVGGAELAATATEPATEAKAGPRGNLQITTYYCPATPR
jgi:hypothetical protein